MLTQNETPLIIFLYQFRPFQSSQGTVPQPSVGISGWQGFCGSGGAGSHAWPAGAHSGPQSSHYHHMHHVWHNITTHVGACWDSYLQLLFTGCQVSHCKEQIHSKTDNLDAQNFFSCSFKRHCLFTGLVNCYMTLRAGKEMCRDNLKCRSQRLLF